MDEKLTLDPSTTALIMVDMQNDFCHPDGFFSRIEHRMQTIGLEPKLVQGSVPRMKTLLEASRKAGMFIVHTRVNRDPQFAYAKNLHSLITPQTYSVWPSVSEDAGMVPGSWGAATHSDLKPLPGEYEVDKRGFSSFYQTDLEMVLRRRGIRTVAIAGTVTYVCVLHTAFDAHDRDFNVILISDGTSSWAPELQAPVLRIADLILGAAIPTSELIEALCLPLNID